jgi:hypothetical protein
MAQIRRAYGAETRLAHLPFGSPRVKTWPLQEQGTPEASFGEEKAVAPFDFAQGESYRTPKDAAPASTANHASLKAGATNDLQRAR